MYTFVLTLHLISAILFIGTVYFRTFAILPFVKEHHFMKQAYDLSGIRGRFLAYFFVTILLISGLYLAYITMQNKIHFILLDIKMTLGILIILIFYFAKKIVLKFKHIPNFGKIFHIGLFVSMIIVVILAKYMFVLGF